METRQVLCPACESPFVVQVAAATLLDRLASLVSVFPFQCELCKRRFQAKQAGGQFSGLKERRKSVQVPVQIPVTFESGEVSGEGTLTDISPHGCSLLSEHPLKYGIVLRLNFPVGSGPKPGGPAQQLATVMGVNGNRAGLTFLAYSSQDRDALVQTVTRSIKIFAAKK
jgi:hypothetical protein